MPEDKRPSIEPIAEPPVSNSINSPATPSIFQALIPVLALMLLLSLSVYYFSDDSSYGANQIALLVAAGVAAVIGLRLGHSWQEIETSIIQGISNAMIAILVLLVVGSLIGTWLLAGTVQSLIYYGLLVISAEWFYAAACLSCAIAAMIIGSSWTVAGTIGVAFIGMAIAMKLDPAIAAGAIVSGAYFGDKLSPLSETTNLAAAVTETDLFTHIRHLLWTTIPSFVIAISLFIFIGGEVSLSSEESIQATMAGLQENYAIGIHLLLPAVILCAMAWGGIPALPSIALAALIGGLFAIVFQRDALITFVNNPALNQAEQYLIGVWTALFNGYSINSDNEALNNLLSRGGMSSMLNTVWIILCAMAFGSVMEKIGLLERLLRAILNSVEKTAGLIIATVFTCIGTNIIAADQYISIVLPGRMFRLEYKRRGLASQNLSRTLEDAGTLTSALIPWNTCGVFMAGTLGVATIDYMPYAFFNILGPIVCIVFALSHFKIEPLKVAA